LTIEIEAVEYLAIGAFKGSKERQRWVAVLGRPVERRMKMTYFFATGLPTNKDIERHRKVEMELRQAIEELELLDDSDEFKEMRLRAKRYFLSQLLESKSQVVNKLGRAAK
jgi:hypothetical protein